jgi:hypothetical protein
VVNKPEKGVERRRIQGESEKNDACLYPRSSKIFVHHVRDLGGATSNVGRPKCLATTVWPWRPYLSSAWADEFSSLFVMDAMLRMASIIRLSGVRGPTVWLIAHPLLEIGEQN